MNHRSALPIEFRTETFGAVGGTLGAILQSLVEDGDRGEFRDFVSAEQASMAVQSVVVAFQNAGGLDEGRSKNLQSRVDQLSKQEKMVESNQRRLAEKLDDATRRQKELDDLLDIERQTMHQLSGLSREEAENRLLGRLEKELVKEQGALVMRYEREAVEKSQVKAKEMLITAIQRFAASHTAESTTSTVDIPNDEMKGRIIGREGRNIRAFEKATGVDVIIDDTPGVVIVSAFDPGR